MTQAKIAKRSLNPIPSSMRGKKRHILFELKSASALTKNSAEQAVFSTFLRLYGSLGVGRQRLQLVFFDPKSGKGILRCALECLAEAKAGLLFVQDAQGQKTIPRVLAVSGSVRKLKALASAPQAGSQGKPA